MSVFWSCSPFQVCKCTAHFNPRFEVLASEETELQFPKVRVGQTFCLGGGTNFQPLSQSDTHLFLEISTLSTQDSVYSLEHLAKATISGS